MCEHDSWINTAVNFLQIFKIFILIGHESF